MGLPSLYTPKQIEVLSATRSRDWFMLINSGAKRSGKTVINNDLFLMELRRVKRVALLDGVQEPMYILGGVSSGTIEKNILQELYNKYEIEPKFDKYNNFKLFGVKVVMARTGNIGGVGSIRGMTSYGAYINEASLANPMVFQEIVSRCSGRGARIICDTNPDNPEHWLKKKYIDNAGKGTLNFHFKLEDNTFLNKRYVEEIKAITPSGMFYDRDILGLWVTADGVVYPDYDGQRHAVSADEVPPIHHYYAGVDWGYDHYGSIVILGETSDGRIYIVDGIAEQYEEIDYWVEQAKMFKLKYGDIDFYADSARPEHVMRFAREGLRVHNARKEVIAGIEEVAKRWKNDTLFYVKGSIPRFEDEIYQYRWQTNSTQDAPVKEYDDVLDSIRYAVYTEHNAKIKLNLFKGGF